MIVLFQANIFYLPMNYLSVIAKGKVHSAKRKELVIRNALPYALCAMRLPEPSGHIIFRLLQLRIGKDLVGFSEFDEFT